MAEVTAEVLAGHFGISATAVQALARRGIVVRGGRGKFKLEESTRAYCGHLRSLAHGRKESDGPGAGRARLAAAQAEAVELKNRRLAGSLVDAAAVQAEWTGVCLQLRAGVLRLPRRAGARLGLTAQQVRGLDDECRAVLTELGTN